MQQFMALFKKEMNSYFKSCFAYLIFFIYLFVSTGCAFYFGAYLAMHDTSVYALFYLQPAILALLIPALTMRLWSDEYRSGTAEFLLTQPVANKLPVLAKFAAAGSMAILMSLFLLPFIIYTASWLKIDWGNIICNYAGVWLYILLFCALGCFVSSLSKYVIISYLLTVFVSALWLLVPFSKLYDAYNNFLFAETGIFDLLYFITFTAALVWLNVLVLNYRRSAQKNKNLKFWSFAVLFVGGVIILNIASFKLFDNYRVDLTANKQYTLAPSSVKLVNSVVKPISLDVYISKDLKAKNAEYYYYFQQTKRFIEKYQRASDSMIKVNVTEVEAFSEMEKAVLAGGLYYEENLKGTKDYFGAIIRDNEGQGVAIKQIMPQRRAFLEKDIDKALLKLTDKEVIKSVGVYFDLTQNLEKFNGFLLNLEDDYNVVNVTDDTYEISSNLDLLILVNPKRLSVNFMYAVDQYIANGGKTLIFFDLLTKGQSEKTNYEALDVVLFLDQLKILLGENLVDEGSIARDYATSELKLDLYKTVDFTVDEKEFAAEPVIKSEKGYIGAVLSGRYKSAFAKNPHKSSDVLRNMMPQTLYSAQDAVVALVGDADIIENDTWIDENSSDENPYSVIYKSANMEVVRSLIDKLAGNEVYNNLPQNRNYESISGIGDQINAMVFSNNYEEYSNILEAMKVSRLKLLQKSEGDEERLQTLMQVDKAGLELGEAEQNMQNLFYRIRKEYSDKVNQIIILSVLLLPAAATLLLFLVALIAGARKKRRIEEFLHD